MGDFQTPADFAQQCVQAVGAPVGGWSRVLEPTCGNGSFLATASAITADSAELIGIELQERRAAEARQRLSTAAFAERATWRIISDDFLRMPMSDIQWRTEGPLLVVGNPPWITLADLPRSGSRVKFPVTLPGRGADAATGAANSDLAECVWQRLLFEMNEPDMEIALLSKTSVAHRVLALLSRYRLPATNIRLWPIDARAVFGAEVDACLLAVRLGSDTRATACTTHRSLDAEPSSTIPLEQAHAAEGVRSPIEWRQGIKHDLVKVMQLGTDQDGVLRNGYGDVVDVEPCCLSPMLKAADVHAGRPPAKTMVVTQRHTGDDTKHLQEHSPRLWAYLQRHRALFDARRSRIYRNRPPFSLFGVGPYTFTNWKIAVSGMHEHPRFRAVGPYEDRPVVFDDTCYLTACDDEIEAALIEAVMTSSPIRQQLDAQIDAWRKRPITKRVLSRLDLAEAMRTAKPQILSAAGKSLSVMHLHPGAPELGERHNELADTWSVS